MVLAIGDFAGKVLAFVITIIRTRSLTAEEFGGYGVIISTIGMFAQVSGFSLGIAATRFIAQHQSSEVSTRRAITQFICLTGVMMTLLTVVVFQLVAPWMVTSNPGLLSPLRWSSLILVTQTLSGLLLGVLIGQQRYRAATLATFSQNIVMLILTAWWAPVWGLEGTIWAAAAGFLTTLLMAWSQSKELLSWPWEPWSALRQHWHILITFCIPTLLAGAILFPASWLAMMLIAQQTGSPWNLLGSLFIAAPLGLATLILFADYSFGLRQVAYFTAADQFRPLLTMLSSVISQPLMPLVTSQLHKAQQGETEAIRRQAQRHAQRAIERSFQLATCLILPLHALLAFAGPYIMAIFGRQFATEWNVFLTMVAFGAYYGIAGLATSILTSLNRMWTVNVIQVGFAFSLVAITYLLQSYGAIGLGIAYFVSTFLALTVTSWIAHQAGYLTWLAMLVQLGAFLWILLISLLSAWTPAAWRLFAVPLACLTTASVVFLTMRTEFYTVFELFRQKLRRRK